jgi:hypothetical protein
MQMRAMCLFVSLLTSRKIFLKGVAGSGAAIRISVAGIEREVFLIHKKTDHPPVSLVAYLFTTNA